LGKFEYSITEEIATLSEKNGFSKEINMISYNGAEPKIDIRNWSDDEGERKMGKGITLTKEEARILRDALEDMDLDE
jgi:hypothetical protein